MLKYFYRINVILVVFAAFSAQLSGAQKIMGLYSMLIFSFAMFLAAEKFNGFMPKHKNQAKIISSLILAVISLSCILLSVSNS